MALVGKDILHAARLLNAGKLVAIPTETVYGLAANALDAKAVALIFETKGRPQFDPLIVHTYSLEKAKEYVSEFPEPLLTLAKKYWPGPLTILLPKKNSIPDLVTSGLPRVAIRVPAHFLTLKLLEETGFPLAAPSANPFGYISPTKPSHVNKQLGERIEYILDGGSCEVGLESTIVGMENEKICIYRLGGLAVNDIEKEIGKVELKINSSSDPTAPGQLKSHYAPGKTMLIGNLIELARKYSQKKLGLIAFGQLDLEPGKNLLINLSLKEDLGEAAANLFSVLRQMDDSDVDMIICDLVPPKGLGLAINDRLKRAAQAK
jgi:L-threonylcarbamoyladenylate synthase